MVDHMVDMMKNMSSSGAKPATLGTVEHCNGAKPAVQHLRPCASRPSVTTGDSACSTSSKGGATIKPAMSWEKASHALKITTSVGVRLRQRCLCIAATPPTNRLSMKVARRWPLPAPSPSSCCCCCSGRVTTARLLFAAEPKASLCHLCGARAAKLYSPETCIAPWQPPSGTAAAATIAITMSSTPTCRHQRPEESHDQKEK
mmetsp:Transcript_23744/g.58947  ORF Transcript_23744/g.58947 Transcript_23744/m.58947 type:complete len:202 (+) Transcript_23744:231-836(+)